MMCSNCADYCKPTADGKQPPKCALIKKSYMEELEHRYGVPKRPVSGPAPYARAALHHPAREAARPQQARTSATPPALPADLHGANIDGANIIPAIRARLGRARVPPMAPPPTPVQTQGQTAQPPVQSYGQLVPRSSPAMTTPWQQQGFPGYDSQPQMLPPFLAPPAFGQSAQQGYNVQPQHPPSSGPTYPGVSPSLQQNFSFRSTAQHSLVPAPAFSAPFQQHHLPFRQPVHIFTERLPGVPSTAPPSSFRVVWSDGSQTKQHILRHPHTGEQIDEITQNL